jgi:microcystin-dependent protein
MTQYTDTWRIAQPETGSEDGTWGSVLNSNLAFMEQGADGMIEIDLDGQSGTYTLSVENESSDESRRAYIRIVSTPSDNVEITTPSVLKMYIIDCRSPDVSINTSSGTAVPLEENARAFFFCDGTQWYRMTPWITADGDVTIEEDIVVEGSLSVEGEGAVLPGTIGIWTKDVSELPTGWAFCDGTNGTPDLRDRFIIGAGGSYDLGDTGGSVTVSTTTDGSHTHSTNNAGSHNHGGTNNHTLNITRMPSHAHDYDWGALTSAFGANAPANQQDAGSATTSGNRGGSNSHSHGISNDGSHSHTLQSNGSHDHTIETLSPYMALPFAMKT